MCSPCSTSEQRQGNGQIQPVSAPLVSGSDYVVSLLGTKSRVCRHRGYGCRHPGHFRRVLDAAGIFYGGLRLQGRQRCGPFSMDGVIGWGVDGAGDGPDGVWFAGGTQGVPLRHRQADTDVRSGGTGHDFRRLPARRFHAPDLVDRGRWLCPEWHAERELLRWLGDVDRRQRQCPRSVAPPTT